MSKKLSPHNVILSPVITEKATDKRAYNKYSFFVDLRANKKEIKDSVERLFDVKVISVNTMHIKGKQRRMGRFEGRLPKKKKALVTLKQGDRIKQMEGP